MRISKICVIGGSGFVGRHVVRRLARPGVRVCVPTRNRERAKDQLIVLPTVDLLRADVHDARALLSLTFGMDAVINLAGILHQQRAGDFQRVHVELPRQIIEACKANGVPRLVHMSALGASVDAPSEYLRSKGEAEQLIRASGLDFTLFRPSVIFGPGDSFVNLFAKLLRMFPVVPLGSPEARFQPVFVEDVAHAFAASLPNPECYAASYDLCGPKIYTLRELLELIGAITGDERPVLGLSDRASYAQAWAMEFLPVKLLTRDNYRSMKVDSVCACPFPPIFGIEPAALEAIVPAYLAHIPPRERYNLPRDRAGR